MLEVLPQTEENLIATRVTDKLFVKDYRLILPHIENVLKLYDKANWYFEMVAFEGWDLAAFWEDVKFDLKHANDFHKIAMVGEKKWEKWMSKLMHPFTGAEVKYFNMEEKEAAMQWVKS
jgi:hypothetical protein